MRHKTFNSQIYEKAFLNKWYLRSNSKEHIDLATATTTASRLRWKSSVTFSLYPGILVVLLEKYLGAHRGFKWLQMELGART